MADETTETTASEAPEATAATTSEPTASTTGAGPEGGPVPGDPSSEQVATAAQSHVAGRVGPPSIQQDATADYHTGEGVETIKPGEVRPANTAIEGGPVPPAVTPSVYAAMVAEGLETSAASGASGSPTSPAGGSTPSDQAGSAESTEPADSGTSGSTGDPAGSSEPAGSTSDKSSRSS